MLTVSRKDRSFGSEMPTDAIVQIPRLANDLMTRIHEESSNGALYTVQVLLQPPI